MYFLFYEASLVNKDETELSLENMKKRHEDATIEIQKLRKELEGNEKSEFSFYPNFLPK